MSVQVLITADNHLDPSALYFGPRRFERRKDHLRCFEEVISYAKANKPDLFLVAGDLFDGMRPGNFIRAWVMEEFRLLHDSGVKVLLVSGHHDTPKSVDEGLSPLAVYGNSGYAVFFENPSEPAQIKLSISGREVSIFGLSYNPLLEQGQDPLSNLRLNSDGDLNIMLVHYAIEGFAGYTGDEPIIKLSSVPSAFQLVAAGHFHAYQAKRVGNTMIVYPGSTERISFQEEDDKKGFAWVEITREGVVSAEHLRTSARPYRTLRVDFPSKESPVELLKKRLDEASDREAVLRLKLLGRATVDQLSAYRRSELLIHGQDKFFHLSVDDSELEIESPEPLEALPRSTPLQELRRYFLSIMEHASGEERDIIREALKLSESKLLEAGAW